jgi:hypothetical protein
MSRMAAFIVSIAVAYCAWAAPVHSEGVEDVLARARKLNESGEPSEATAVLARAFAQQRDVSFLKEWLAIDDKRLTDFESKLIRKTMPPLPSFELHDTASTVVEAAVEATATEAKKTDTSAWRDWSRWVYLWPIDPAPVPNPTPILLAETARQYDAALKKQREQLAAEKPAILGEEEVRQRLLSIDDCFRSMNGCSAAVSAALQAAPANQMDALVAMKNQTRSYIKRLRDMRATFISYDHLAPRVIDARISLVPNALGVTGHYVTDDSLKHAAEMLGSVGSDWEYAHNDVKRLWLDGVSTLKQFAGKEKFESLQALATTVGNSKHNPDQWEPK